MITLRKKYILILLVFVILTSLIASFLHNPIVTMADGAMSGTPWRGSDIDIKEIYSYYTRQGAKNDYILVLENFHGAMRSSDKQPFFTHQNYIFDVVTGYHVHNRSQQNNETLAFKIDNKNDNSFIKEFNTNHHRWCGQFSLPSSSKFYINNDKQSVDMLNKSVLVNFKITTDLSSAGWALQATNNVPQSQIDEPEYLIPVVEFDLSETSASDMSIIGTH